MAEKKAKAEKATPKKKAPAKKKAEKVSKKVEESVWKEKGFASEEAYQRFLEKGF
tara:strand:+ start:115 stop:279 length:165 start_codon:yes stop_codon:yes gene_type:complete